MHLCDDITMHGIIVRFMHKVDGQFKWLLNGHSAWFAVVTMSLSLFRRIMNHQKELMNDTQKKNKKRFSLFWEVAAAAAVVLCATGNCNAPQTHSTLNLNKFSNHCLNFLPIQWNAFSIRVFVYRSGIHIYIALAMRVARPSILPSSTRFVPLEILCDRRKLNEQILTLPASLSSSSSRFPFILSSLEQILSLSRIWRGIVSPAL